MYAKWTTLLVLALGLAPAAALAQPDHRAGAHGYDGYGTYDNGYERYDDGYDRHRGDRYHKHYRPRHRKGKKHYARHRKHAPRIHRRHFPPAGYCRVWLRDRAPRHQPPPVHCSYVRGVPPHAIVLTHRGVAYDRFRYNRYYRGSGYHGPRLKGYVVYER